MWQYFQDEWLLYSKVTFDGVNRHITVNPGVTSIDIKSDVYSEWKKWVQTYDYSKYGPAIRTTGGDPIGGGLYSGDIYFLRNEWKLLINFRTTSVTGVLFSDDYDTAYYDIDDLSAMYPARVSSIVNTISTGGGSGITAADVWTYSNRSLTQSIPTAVQVRQEIDNNSTKLTSILNKANTLPSAAAVATAVKNELAPDFAAIDASITSIQGGLSVDQADMLLKLYVVMGLDPTKPLIVTQNQRIAGDITQTIQTSSTQTIVTRV